MGTEQEQIIDVNWNEARDKYPNAEEFLKDTTEAIASIFKDDTNKDE